MLSAQQLLVVRLSHLKQAVLSRVKYSLKLVHGDADFKWGGAYSKLYFVSCLVSYLRHFTSETGQPVKFIKAKRKY